MRITSLALALALLGGCGVEQIDVALQGRIDLPGSHRQSAVLLPDLRVEGITALPFAAAHELRSKGAGVEDIARVHLTSLALLPPAGEDLDFVDYVQVFLGAPGQPEVPVAEKHVPDGAHTLDLEVSDEDLAAYATAKNMTLRASMQLRRQPRDDVAIGVTAHFLVDVTSVGP